MDTRNNQLDENLKHQGDWQLAENASDDSRERLEAGENEEEQEELQDWGNVDPLSNPGIHTGNDPTAPGSAV